MPHYSEMDFLFSPSNREYVNRVLNNTSTDNTQSIFGNRYVVYKRKDTTGGTDNIKNYLKESVYKNEDSTENPYIKLVKDFNSSSPGLEIKAADLAYLRDLGVYPMNRMAILRRFPEGSFVKEDLSEMKLKPISTVIGWIPPDQNFGTVTFNENWGKTNERFDQMIAKILKEKIGFDITSLIPIPGFAQGILYQFYKYAGVSGIDEETGQVFDYKEIPVGDPNMLMEGPYRTADSQNIQSEFTFNLETTYEQKLLGDVDPGSAMLDIIDNLYAMGTSYMKFYWNENSDIINKAKVAIGDKANSPTAWWDFLKELITKFWDTLKNILKGAANEVVDAAKGLIPKATPTQVTDAQGETYYKSGDSWFKKNGSTPIFVKDADKIANLNNLQTQTTTKAEAEINEKMKLVDNTFDLTKKLGQSILTSTVSIYRFELRGSIELMTGGRDSSTPWYLTLGNPYSPWLASNHIIVSSAQIETSTEMGFNDQPQWLKATFNCRLSRALGRQELMRMFNNTYRRNYSDPLKVETKTTGNEVTKTTFVPGFGYISGTAEDIAAAEEMATKNVTNTYTKSQNDTIAKKTGMMSDADYRSKYPIKTGG